MYKKIIGKGKFLVKFRFLNVMVVCKSLLILYTKAKERHIKVTIPKSSVGRLRTHLLHGTHNITPNNRTIPPEEEMWAD